VNLLLLQQLTQLLLLLLCMQLRVAVVGGGTGEVLAAAGITPEFTATKVRCSFCVHMIEA
jgi:uroporphyrinogen-III synthase